MPIEYIQSTRVLSKEDNVRIQLKITDERKEDLDLLRDVTGAGDYASLLDAALTAFRWMVYEVGHGREIVSLKEGDQIQRVLTMPELQLASVRYSKVMGEPEGEPVGAAAMAAEQGASARTRAR